MPNRKETLKRMLAVHRFDQLQAVDVEGVPPATRADLSEENLLRADIPRTFVNRCISLLLLENSYYICKCVYGC